jgi:hypothetical protein
MLFIAHKWRLRTEERKWGLLVAIIVVNGGGDFYTTMVSYEQPALAAPSILLVLVSYLPA